MRKELDPLIFPGFRLIVEIAAGESGAVWRARELESQRLVALKVYHPELLRRAGFVSGLDQAVLAAREFHHPAAARVLGLTEAKTGGGLALVSELVGGEVLSRALQRNVRFSAARALRLARLMAEALAAAHARRLCAGTLHPGHVVISGESAKILGLGTAGVEGLPGRYDHAPEEGRFAPAAYAAPELLSGSAPDARSDVFALGALLYHMLTGLVPFRARELAGLKLERAEGLHWPRGADSLIPPAALGLVGRALELDPALRPSAADFARAAGQAVLGAEPAQADGRSSTRMDLAPMVRAPVEILPSEPRVGGAAAAAPRSRGRLRDALLGAVAATVLLGAGVLLGRVLWSRPAPAPAVPPKPPIAEGPVRPTPPLPPAPPADDGRREFEAVQTVLAEKPATLGPVKERLAELARKHRGSEWGMRAELKLAELAEAESRDLSAGLRKLLDRAAELEKRERFGEAAALLEKPPAELAGTGQAARAAEEAAALRRRAAERYRAVSQRAERSVADGDLSAAILDYQRVADNFGIAELTAAAAKRIGELGAVQERASRDAARQRELERQARAAEALRKALESARANLALFRYPAGLEALAAAAADAEQSPEARRLLGRYLEMVRAEEKLFKLTAKRVADGIKDLTISQGDSDTLKVVRLDEKGITADGTSIKGLLFTWDRIPAAQAYRSVKLISDDTSAEEHLALATFAFHRDQTAEIQNNLTVAVDRDPAQKEAAAAQTEVYRWVEGVRQPRRQDQPGETRRREPEAPAEGK